MRPRHPKPDANQLQIVGQLRDLGFIVHDVSSLGGDVLDLFIGGMTKPVGYWDWVQGEVKMPGEKLTPGERAYFDKLEQILGPWVGTAVIKIESVDDVLEWFGWI
jgi:hypothetical protein